MDRHLKERTNSQVSPIWNLNSPLILECAVPQPLLGFSFWYGFFCYQENVSVWIAQFMHAFFDFENLVPFFIGFLPLIGQSRQ